MQCKLPYINVRLFKNKLKRNLYLICRKNNYLIIKMHAACRFEPVFVKYMLFSENEWI